MKRVETIALLPSLILVAACAKGTPSLPPSPAVSGQGSASPPAAAAPNTAQGASTPAAEPQAAPLSYELRLGQEVYRRYCMTCHGETGAGDGFNAFNLDPRPKNLADASFQKKSDADVKDTIRRGGAGVGLSSLMPPWGHTLSDRQIDAVVEYVRNLPKPQS